MLSVCHDMGLEMGPDLGCSVAQWRNNTTQKTFEQMKFRKKMLVIVVT